MCDLAKSPGRLPLYRCCHALLYCSGLNYVTRSRVKSRRVRLALCRGISCWRLGRCAPEGRLSIRAAVQEASEDVQSGG